MCLHYNFLFVNSVQHTMSRAIMATDVYDTHELLLYPFEEKENLDLSFWTWDRKKIIGQKKLCETVSLEVFLFDTKTIICPYLSLIL